MATHQVLTAPFLHRHCLERVPSLDFPNFEAALASRLGDLEIRCAKMWADNAIRRGESLP